MKEGLHLAKGEQGGLGNGGLGEVHHDGHLWPRIDDSRGLGVSVSFADDSGRDALPLLLEGSHPCTGLLG